MAVANLKSKVLINLIHEHIKLKSIGIVEVGVYKGETAQHILSNLIECGIEVSYYGFDLFEDAANYGIEKTNPGIHHRTVSSGKIQEMSLKVVESKLEKITPNVFLIKGDSGVTLPQMAETLKNCNFFYIDGGHDYASVKKDWENISKIAQKGSLIVFDDANAAPIRKLIDEVEESGVVVKGAPHSRKYIIKE